MNMSEQSKAHIVVLLLYIYILLHRSICRCRTGDGYCRHAGSGSCFNVIDRIASCDPIGDGKMPI